MVIAFENGKPRNHAVSGVLNVLIRLALAELGSATGSLEAVLLTLLHTRIAGQETGGLEGGTVLGVDLQQSAGNAVTDSAGLAGHTAAGDGGLDVHLAQGIGGGQRLTHDELQGLQAKVIVDVPAVDGDSAGAVGEEMHAGHGGLPAAGAIQIRLLALIHSFVPPA